MKMMVKNDMVTRLPRIVPLDGLCEACVLQKNHQTIFETSWRKNAWLELVHSDLCTLNKPSILGARYHLNFIDDFLGILGCIYETIRIMYLKNTRKLGHLWVYKTKSHLDVLLKGIGIIWQKRVFIIKKALAICFPCCKDELCLIYSFTCYIVWIRGTLNGCQNLFHAW